jgi:hypothetical protein
VTTGRNVKRNAVNRVLLTDNMRRRGWKRQTPIAIAAVPTSAEVAVTTVEPERGRNRSRAVSRPIVEDEAAATLGDLPEAAPDTFIPSSALLFELAPLPLRLSSSSSPSERLPPPPPPPPPPLSAPDPLVDGQAILDDGYVCGLCELALITPREYEEAPERLVGLACTDPPTHVFHGSCLDEWRSSKVTDLAVICPTCMVNPMQAISRRVAAKTVKARIKVRRESCWRFFWAEWARQRYVVLMIMMVVALAFIAVNVLEEWIRGWTREK